MKYVRDLTAGELVDAHDLCRPLFGVIDNVVHTRTIDTIIVALVDTLTFYLGEQPQKNARKSSPVFGSTLSTDAAARNSAVVCSLALQFGTPVETTRRALHAMRTVWPLAHLGRALDLFVGSAP